MCSVVVHVQDHVCSIAARAEAIVAHMQDFMCWNSCSIVVCSTAHM